MSALDLRQRCTMSVGHEATRGQEQRFTKLDDLHNELSEFNLTSASWAMRLTAACADADTLNFCGCARAQPHALRRLA